MCVVAETAPGDAAAPGHTSVEGAHRADAPARQATHHSRLQAWPQLLRHRRAAEILQLQHALAGLEVKNLSDISETCGVRCVVVRQQWD